MFYRHVSGIWLPDCSELALYWKNSNDVTIFQQTSSSIFFDVVFFLSSSLVTSCYWPKFHVNIITGSRVMAISFYKRLTRNPEIGNTPVWVLPNIWRLGWVRNTKFDTNVSNKVLLECSKIPGLQLLPCLSY